MKAKFYNEQKHKESLISVDMLKGSINRMCVTDDTYTHVSAENQAQMSKTIVYKFSPGYKLSPCRGDNL